MSAMLMELVGRLCLVKTEDEEYLTGSADIPCRVTGADDDWLRVSYTDHEGRRLSRLSRVETLADVFIFDE